MGQKKEAEVANDFLKTRLNKTHSLICSPQ